LKAEIRSNIIKTQDLALQTKYLVITILQTGTDNRCRLSKKFDHEWNTISACPILTKEQYLNGHDRIFVCTELHFDVCKGIVVKLRKD
jgi:hypothetical protein